MFSVGFLPVDSVLLSIDPNTEQRLNPQLLMGVVASLGLWVLEIVILKLFFPLILFFQLAYCLVRCFCLDYLHHAYMM